MTITNDDEAYKGLADLSAAPLWRYLGDLFRPEPKSAAVPVVWHYESLREYAMYFAEHLPIEDAQRRVLMLVNPGLEEPPATVNTLYAGHPDPASGRAGASTPTHVERLPVRHRGLRCLHDRGRRAGAHAASVTF